MADLGFYEGVEVAGEDGVRVGGFGVGAEVFDEFVGVEDVVADLGAPGGVGGAGFELLLCLFSFCFLLFPEFGFEDGQGGLAVLDLGALGLRGGGDAGGCVF